MLDDLDVSLSTRDIQTFPLSNELLKLCDENYDLKHEQAHIQAKVQAGYSIVSNTDNLLTFDLDGEGDLHIFQSRIGFLEKKGFEPNVTITKSKSGNYHAQVAIGVSVPEALRIAIQACLGSDWKREMLGVLRQLNGQVTQVSLLFIPNPTEVVPWP